MRRLLFRFFLLPFVFQATSAVVFGSIVLVAGNQSDNVVKFDLKTGQWSEIVHLSKGAHPRGITVGDRGEIFLGLQGTNKNIVKLTFADGIVGLKNVTGSIGRFGPGIIVFGNGRIWIAGDTDRAILNVNPETGEIFKPPQFKNDYNLVGLAADGATLYAAQYFQRSILRYDLKSDQMNAVLFIAKSPHLNRPIGMTIGHNGNLRWTPKTGPLVKMDFRRSAGEKADDESQTQTA